MTTSFRRPRLACPRLAFPRLASLVMALLACNATPNAQPANRTPSPQTSAHALGDAAALSRASYTGFAAPLARTQNLAHVAGRKGDLELVGARGTSLVVATQPDDPGTLPLRGAWVDLLLQEAPGVDPLFAWRPAWVSKDWAVMPWVADEVTSVSCVDPGTAAGPGAAPANAPAAATAAATGILSKGRTAGTAWQWRLCARDDGSFEVSVEADGLPNGLELGEQINPGSARVLVDAPQVNWEGEADTSFLALAEDDVAVVIEGAPFRARRNLVHITTSIFPGQILTRSQSAGPRPKLSRVVRARKGSVLDLLPDAGAAARKIHVPFSGFDARGSGAIVLYDRDGKEIGTRPLPLNEGRLSLPAKLGSAAAILDAANFAVTPRTPLAGAETTMPTPVAAAVGTLAITLRDATPAAPAAAASSLPYHVIVRGRDGTPTPGDLGPSQDGAYVALNSAYLTKRGATLPLRVGRYRVTATAGPAYSLFEEDIEIAAGRETVFMPTLVQEIDTSQYTACDLHLHAGPSPDAPMAMEGRVASLAAVGLELAVATDHNAITDYRATVEKLGLGGRLATIVGDEITSNGARKWGHFNAFPMPLGETAYRPVPAYFETPPAKMFASARAFGARTLQVNHARMEPQIGYFDLTHFDARTGRADAEFDGDFDLLEVHNGLWMTEPARVREGLSDAFGLVRRGKRVTVTGNSDSHKLYFEAPGYPRTYAKTPAMPREGRESRVLDALLRGAVTVSAGPFVEMKVAGQDPGAQVRLKRQGAALAPVDVWVRVSAPSWVPVETIEVLVNDKAQQVFSVTPPARATAETQRKPPNGKAETGLRFERRFKLSVQEDSAISIWVSAKQELPSVLAHRGATPLGFTGFVYLDADGDGKVTIPAQK